MSKSVTVNFEDGSSHVYDNVPDSVDDDQIRQRAEGDFEGIKVTGVDSSAKVAPKPEPSQAVKDYQKGEFTTEGIVGGLQTGVQLANEFLHSPLGYATEAIAGKKFVLDPVLDAIKNRGGPVAPPAAPMPAPAAPAIQVPANTGGLPRPNISAPGTPAQTFEALRSPAPRMTPVLEAPPAAAQQPGIMQRGMDYARQMQRVAADKVMQGARAAAPYAESAAGAARAIAPAAIGLTAALMPGNANQNYPVPQKGPYRGMEINPMTGRPWTPQELAQYR